MSSFSYSNINVRQLTERLQTISPLFGLLCPTPTILGKGYFTAIQNVRDFLMAAGCHDFDAQGYGREEAGVTLPALIIEPEAPVETTVSLYKTKSKGEPRIWVYDLPNHATAGDVIALFSSGAHLLVVNCTRALDDIFSDTSDLYIWLLSTLKGQVATAPAQEPLALENLEFDHLVAGDKDTEVEEDAASTPEEAVRFEVSSYGWDSDVDGLVKRLKRGDIYKPHFQRGLVWNKTDKSKFVESLILGLPVPSIFLALDSATKKMGIVDGQQRLRALEDYLSNGFALSGSDIQDDLKGRFFTHTNPDKGLSEEDNRTLADAVLHAVVIRSEGPETNSEVYQEAVIQIFKRLNTSGKPLQPQEVRSSILFGEFNDLLLELNEDHNWRALFGPVHSRMKDMEAILRFFAIYDGWKGYRPSMPRYLDRFMAQNRHQSDDARNDKADLFIRTIGLLRQACGDDVFRKGGTFLLSKWDALAVGLATAQVAGKSFTDEEVAKREQQLVSNSEYQYGIEEFVNDADRLQRRVHTAVEIFMS